MLLDTFLNKLQINWTSINSDLIIKAETSLFRKIPIIFNPPTLVVIPNTPGVYLFFIKPKKDLSHENFTSLWQGPNKKAFSSKIKKSKITLLKAGVWHPLYIGKSEELYTRVNQHCFHELGKTTYSIKLGTRTEIIEAADFAFGFYELNMTDTFSNYLFQFVLVNLERELRNKYLPLIGRQ